MRIIKKLSVLLLSLFIAFGISLVPVNALEQDETIPFAIETYTYSADYGLGDPGYVTCTIQVRININTGVCTLSGVSVTEHFTSSYPLYTLIGEPTSDPDRGEVIENGYVDVTFKVYNGLPLNYGAMSWTRTCRVYF